MPLDSTLSRRHVLQLLAGGATFATGIRTGAAGEARIGRLIAEASDLPTIAQRIDFISRALLGTPYRGYMLIGGPSEPEQFVVRDDAFDCVTFCETVLAAARVRRPSEFETALRHIRYRDGRVEWPARNHYFSDWSEFNTANGTCRRVAMPGCVALRKTLAWMPELGQRRMSLIAVPRTTLLAHRGLLASGDIIGFLSERPKLDYFHTGFIVIGDGGELLLRHAAKSKDRVLDESLARFLAVNHVRAVTLLRPQEPWVQDEVV
jgi:hypothetical protein